MFPPRGSFCSLQGNRICLRTPGCFSCKAKSFGGVGAANSPIQVLKFHLCCSNLLLEWCIWAGKAGWNHQWPKFSAELVLWMSAAFPLHPRFKRQSVRLFASERKLPWWGGYYRSCLRKHLGLGFTLTSVRCNFWVKQRLSSEVAVQAGRFPLGWPAPFMQKNSSKNST